MYGACNIEISWKVLEPTAFARWWSEGDVYMSLHRSEGFGLPLAEALCGGMPVVATGWSGNIDFMNAANSYLLEYSLVDVDDAQGKYPGDLGRWAEASVEHAAAILADLAINSASASAKAIAQAARTQSRLSGKAFVDGLLGENQVPNVRPPVEVVTRS
jgi:glycosyltransferase involved in cell wall biosynthesis